MLVGPELMSTKLQMALCHWTALGHEQLFVPRAVTLWKPSTFCIRKLNAWNSVYCNCDISNSKCDKDQLEVRITAVQWRLLSSWSHLGVKTQLMTVEASSLSSHQQNLQFTQQHILQTTANKWTCTNQNILWKGPMHCSKKSRRSRSSRYVYCVKTFQWCDYLDQFLFSSMNNAASAFSKSMSDLKQCFDNHATTANKHHTLPPG